VRGKMGKKDLEFVAAVLNLNPRDFSNPNEG
jgi:hypothetical protein